MHRSLGFRHLALLPCFLMLAAATARADVPTSVLRAFKPAESALVYQELVDTRAFTYSFYLLTLKDEGQIRALNDKLQQPISRLQSMRTLLKMSPRKLPAFALPASLRTELRQLNDGERSAVFRLSPEYWAIVELESIDLSTKPPAFTQISDQLPALVARGALPSPAALQSDPVLVQRRQLNRLDSRAALARLPADINLNQPLSGGLLPLQMALARGDTELVQAMLQRGADANACAMKDCPVQNAIFHQDPETSLQMLELLLAAGARPDQVSANSPTALTLLSPKGTMALAERLLAAGADPDGGSAPHFPLGQATVSGHRALAELLLEKGADPLRRKPTGMGPLFHTPMSDALNGSPEMAGWLRSVVMKRLAAQPEYQWSGWIEQDGRKFPLRDGDIALKRKPFSLHLRMDPDALIYLEASTDPQLFAELDGNNLKAPLFRGGRMMAAAHDGTEQWLLVSDSKNRTDDFIRGGIHSWGWNADQKDFTRVTTTPQGKVFTRSITQVIHVDEAGNKEEVAIKDLELRAFNIVMGAATGYGNLTADYVNPKRIRLTFAP